MEKSDIVLRAWDNRLRSMDTIILDAIEVFDESNPAVTPIEIETSVSPISIEPESKKIPNWIKNNAKWWAEDQMDDSTFVSGLEFLVQEEIINVPIKANVSLTPEEKEKNKFDWTEETVEQTTEIPNWIKSTANWWSSELISDDEFVLAIEYLIKQGLIKI